MKARNNAALVIDDNPAYSDILVEMLGHYSFKCQQALDGQKALDIIADNEFDVIFLDVNMPEMNGFEFLQAYKGHTPVVMISTDTGASRRAVAQYGAWDFIHKPPSKQELMGILKRLELID